VNRVCEVTLESLHSMIGWFPAHRNPGSFYGSALLPICGVYRTTRDLDAYTEYCLLVNSHSAGRGAQTWQIVVFVVLGSFDFRHRFAARDCKCWRRKLRSPYLSGGIRSRNQYTDLVHEILDVERLLDNLILADSQYINITKRQGTSTEPASIAALICSSRTFAVTAIMGRCFCTRLSLKAGLLRRPASSVSICRIRRVADRPSNTGIWKIESVDIEHITGTVRPYLSVHEHGVEGPLFQEM
jgi:hypothetical protein